MYASPQSPRQPSIPPVPHAQNALFAVVVTVLASRVTQNGGEEPEKSGGPGGDGDADGNEGREQVHDDQHGRAVLGGCGEGVYEVQLQVQRRCEEGGELRGSRRARGEEAEGLEEERDEEGDHGPEHDQKGEEGAGQREIELGRVSGAFTGHGDRAEQGRGRKDAYQQLHGLVLGALLVVVVGMVGNGLARHVRVRGGAALRAVCLLGVVGGAAGGLGRRRADGVVEAGWVPAGGREAARRAGRRVGLEVGRARVGDDRVVGAAVAAALAAPLGALARVVGVLFAVLVANVDGALVLVLVLEDGQVGGRWRRRKLGVHGGWVRLATRAWASTTTTGSYSGWMPTSGRS